MVHAAKTHPSRLLARVEAGDVITIARGRTPVAKLVILRPLARGRARLLGSISPSLQPAPRERGAARRCSKDNHHRGTEYTEKACSLCLCGKNYLTDEKLVGRR